MNSKRCAVLVGLAALVVAGGAACGSDDDSENAAHATSTAATPTSARKLVGPSAAPLPPPSPTHPPAPAPTPTPEPLADVNCGPVTGSNGATADVIAFASAAGRAGCTEAITVASDYVGVPRTGDAQAVDGWTCEPQPDTTIPHICVNQGLTIGLRGQAGPATPPPPAPTPIRTVDPDQPPTPDPGHTVEDVNCGPVTDAGGGTRTVIAVGTAAGRVGCTEAIDVATEFVTTVSDSDTMTVQGWQCAATGCTKDGLTIALN